MVTGALRLTALVFGAVLLAGCAGSGAPARDAGAAAVARPSSPASPAVAAIETALRALGQENLQPLQAMLPQHFIGRANVLDSAARIIAEQKKIEVTLSDVRVQPSVSATGPVAVAARWEKRFLKAPGLTPTVEGGVLAAVLVPAGNGWAFESLNADNPFTR
jgi:hypothetical protein